jgi:hypothetical protein
MNKAQQVFEALMRSKGVHGFLSSQGPLHHACDAGSLDVF